MSEANFFILLKRVVDTIMNDNVLLDEDYKIYNKLISEYPDKKVYGLTKLKYYYEVLKQAKNKK